MNKILVVDYYLCYNKTTSLRITNLSGVIQKLKTAFALYRISESLESDNGPQFSSQEFQQFLDEYALEHTTSSPNFLQANGEAEQAVKNCLNTVEWKDNPLVALLVYHFTLLENG